MAAPLVPIIRDDIDITATQLGDAASASVAGTVIARILMGSLCDTIGPRKAYGVLMLLTALPCYAMTCATKAGHFIACRCLIGFSLASFVSTQYWCVRCALRVCRARSARSSARTRSVCHARARADKGCTPRHATPGRPPCSRPRL
jgi:predicted MFS family arabinose efflux permease